MDLSAAQTRPCREVLLLWAWAQGALPEPSPPTAEPPQVQSKAGRKAGPSPASCRPWQRAWLATGVPSAYPPCLCPFLFLHPQEPQREPEAERRAERKQEKGSRCRAREKWAGGGGGVSSEEGGGAGRRAWVGVSSEGGGQGGEGLLGHPTLLGSVLDLQPPMFSCCGQARAPGLPLRFRGQEHPRSLISSGHRTETGLNAPLQPGIFLGSPHSVMKPSPFVILL